MDPRWRYTEFYRFGRGNASNLFGFIHISTEMVLTFSDRVLVMHSMLAAGVATDNVSAFRAYATNLPNLQQPFLFGGAVLCL